MTPFWLRKRVSTRDVCVSGESKQGEAWYATRDRDRLSSVDGDLSLVEGDQIDLVEPIRETVMIETPTSVLCSDDCKGICDVCGVDRNEASCECVVVVRDERWAALDDLRLDD